MTRLEAIEETTSKISGLAKFLNDFDPKHPVNIVDPSFIEDPLMDLVSACDKATAWLKEEAEKEEAENSMTLDEKYRDLCLRRDMF